jgi:hypothetical protein
MPAAESTFGRLVGNVAWLVHVFEFEATLKFEVVEGGNGPKEEPVIEMPVCSACWFEPDALLTC